MEVANRLKGLDLTDRVPEDLSIEVCNIVQDFPGGSDGKVSAFCLQCGRPRFNLWVRKISWRRKWQLTPENPMDGGSCRLQSMGLQRVRHD